MAKSTEKDSLILRLDQAFLKEFNDLIDDSLGEFELMPGWAHLVWVVGQEVQQLHQFHPAFYRIKLVQVKEKLGTLRLRLSGYTPHLLQLIEDIEDQSATLCMYCGAPGRLELGANALTACRTCKSLRNDPDAARLRKRMDSQIALFLREQAHLAATPNNSPD